MKKLFNIKPQNVTDNFGKVLGVATVIQITVLAYDYSAKLGSSMALYNDKMEVLMPEFNKYINTPENWGTDDSILFQIFATEINITLLDEYTKPETNPSEPEN